MSDATIEDKRKKRAQLARRKRLREEEELDEALSLSSVRIRIALVCFVVLFIASFLISGRAGWIIAWPISFFSTFIDLGLTTIVLVALVVVLLILRVIVPAWKKRRSEDSQTVIRTKAVTASSVALMVGLGVLLPASAWYEARDVLPAVKFNMCVESLRENATVALNEGENGTRYATIASIEDGINKYALEPNQDGGWQVTDMYSNEEVTDLSGC